MSRDKDGTIMEKVEQDLEIPRHFPAWNMEGRIFIVAPCISDIKHFIIPTNAHNVKT